MKVESRESFEKKLLSLEKWMIPSLEIIRDYGHFSSEYSDMCNLMHGLDEEIQGKKYFDLSPRVDRLKESLFYAGSIRDSERWHATMEERNRALERHSREISPCVAGSWISLGVVAGGAFLDKPWLVVAGAGLAILTAIYTIFSMNSYVKRMEALDQRERNIRLQDNNA